MMRQPELYSGACAYEKNSKYFRVAGKCDIGETLL